MTNTWDKFGALCLKKERLNAWYFDFFVIKKWKKAITAPSYSIPLWLVIVKGLKHFQKKFSLILVATNKEIPLINPYFCDKTSSKIIIIIPPMTNCATNNIELK